MPTSKQRVPETAAVPTGHTALHARHTHTSDEHGRDGLAGPGRRGACASRPTRMPALAIERRGDSATVGREFQYAPADSDGVTRTQPAGPGRPDGAGTRRVDPTGRGPAGSARPGRIGPARPDRPGLTTQRL